MVETINIIQKIMIPLLPKAGIHFDTEDYRERALFIGKMEGKMANLQLRNRDPLSFIHNENRCIIFTLSIDGQQAKLKSTYFQVKEDYSLRLFNEKYYSLNIISTHDTLLCDLEEWESVEYFLNQFIFKNLLKMDHLIDIPWPSIPKISVADYILRRILRLFYVWLYSFSLTNSETNNISIQEYPCKRSIPVNRSFDIRKYLDDYKEAFLTSKTFFENILKPLRKSILSRHFGKAIDFALEQSDKIPFIRKSTVFATELLFSTGIHIDICAFLLEDEIYEIYEKQGTLGWHTLHNTFNHNPGVGAFLKATRRAIISNINHPHLAVAKHPKKKKKKQALSPF
jgi:hypothetical protein